MGPSRRFNLRASRAACSALVDVGALGITSGRNAALAARTPLYIPMFARGGRTMATRFSASPSAESSIAWVPSDYVRFISIRNLVRPSTPWNRSARGGASGCGKRPPNMIMFETV